MDGATTEYPVDPTGSYWTTSLGVIIDGAGYTLEGEPPPSKGGIWFTGNGQR